MEITGSGVAKRLIENMSYYILACKKTSFDAANNLTIEFTSWKCTLQREARQSFRRASKLHRTKHLKLFYFHDGRYELIEEYKA